MKIMTWNVNGFRSALSKDGIEKILFYDPDIICLQEMKLSDESCVNDLSLVNYEITLNLSSKKGKSGIAIFSKNKPENIIKNIGFAKFDEDGRFLELSFKEFELINVYMPHGGRDKRDIAYKIEAYKYLIELVKNKKKLVLLGDFNIAETDLDLERYKENTKNTMFTDIERATIKALREAIGFDAFRKKYPTMREYTWFNYAFDAKNRNLGWRIDYIFMSNYFENMQYNISILKNIDASDHCPVLLEY